MARETKQANAFVETVKTIVYALLIAGVVRTLFFQPFWIPSGSMKQTLLIGDFLFVNKLSYGYSYASCPNLPFAGIDAQTLCGFLDGDNTRVWGSEPERGDVVVFRHPVNGSDYIKRVIGLPGDKLQLRDGQIFINGEAVPQDADGNFEELMLPQGPQRLRPRCANGPVGTGGVCLKERYTETLPGGRSYKVLNTTSLGVDNSRVIDVPPGHYFFIGDNRDNSADSRMSQLAGGVGFVPYENLIGRADRIMFSSSGRSMLFFWTWRGDRYFKRIE
ncbi:MAG: signal peptidase I [Rhodobacteraceae bacterium]|nr:signal peptidase I [Paracoccaceae bacterium]